MNNDKRVPLICCSSQKDYFSFSMKGLCSCITKCKYDNVKPTDKFSIQRVWSYDREAADLVKKLLNEFDIMRMNMRNK